MSSGSTTTGFATQYFNGSTTFAAASRVSVRAHAARPRASTPRSLPVGYSLTSRAGTGAARRLGSGVSGSNQTGTRVRASLVLLSGRFP